MLENSLYDQKSLLALTQEKPDWKSVVKDAVAFSNAAGGTIVFCFRGQEFRTSRGTINLLNDQQFEMASKR